MELQHIGVDMYQKYIGLNNWNVNVSECEQIFLISCRHLQRFWGASGNIWQAIWDRMLMIAVYWIFVGIYTILDVTNKPAALRRYKIRPGTNEPVDSKRLMKANIHCFT